MAVEAHVLCSENLTKEPIRKNAPSKLVLSCRLHWRAIIAEIVSTALLMLLGCMTCVPIDGVPTQPLYGPFGFGLIVLLNIQTFGHISGAHMNPSVTLAAVMWRKLSIPLGIAYVLAQCAGAVIGYKVLVELSPGDFLSKGVCVTQPHLSYSSLQALGIEASLTAALVLINCAIWDPVNEPKNESNSVKFGMTIVGLSLAGGPLTGASMNPARSFAPAFWTKMWSAHWVYWVGPLLGGSVAALIYKHIWINKTQQESRLRNRSDGEDQI